MDGHGGRDWLWMTLTVGFWIILLAAAVYSAVTVANGDAVERFAKDEVNDERRRA